MAHAGKSDSVDARPIGSPWPSLPFLFAGVVDVFHRRAGYRNHHSIFRKRLDAEV
jgi:hypothetical protein